MSSFKNALKRAINDIESAQISIEPMDTRFVDAVSRIIPEGKEERAAHLSSGLERLLKRHHDDSLLIASSCAALGGASEYELPIFIKKLSRFVTYLEAPIAAHSLKTIKMANFVHLHPEILKVKNIDSIQALSRLPEGTITPGLNNGEILVGQTPIMIASAKPKEIVAAVKKVRDASAEIRKKDKAERIAQSIEERETMQSVKALEDFDRNDENGEGESESESRFGEEARQGASGFGSEGEERDSLQPQLSEAATALSKVLGSLSRNNANPELSQVLSEARKLLMLAMREGDYVIEPNAKAPGEQTGDFH